MLIGLDRGSIRYLTYQSAKGPVSNFLKRHFEAHPDQSWEEIKKELKVRFAEIIGPQHALLLLRRVKQKPGESVHVYLERLIDLSEDWFEGQPQDIVQKQLIGYFIDGLACF